MRYYWAANIHCVSCWLDETIVLNSWLDMEPDDCLLSSLGAIIMSPIRLKKSFYDMITIPLFIVLFKVGNK